MSSFDFADPDTLESVKQFHNLFRCPVVESPALPSEERSKLRVALLQEEVQELEDAISEKDLIEIADALADIQYVLGGAVLEFGMGSIFKQLFDEVHRSNMSKACSTLQEAEDTRRHYKESKETDSYIQQIDDTKWLVYRQGDDKVLKSVKYSPADLASVLKKNQQGTTSKMPSPAALKSVADFHTLFRAPVLEQPAIPSMERCKLRVSLLKEEVQELEDAVKANDLVEVADALADIQYVLSGAILEFGMPAIFDNLFTEVQRSNMSKACTSLEEAEDTRQHYKATKATESYVQQIDDTKWLVYREGDDKALKSVKYSPASLSGILKQVDSDANGPPSPTSVLAE